MKLALVSTVVFLSYGVGTHVEAGEHGGLLQKLPKDGTWVKYLHHVKVKSPQVNEIQGTVSLRSVGSVVEKGEQCRWIEIQMDVVEQERKRTTLYKILVREKDFQTGAKEARRVLRGWGPGGKKLTDDEIADVGGSGPIPIFLGRPLTHVKPLKEAKVIDYQRGRLKIAAGTIGPLPLGSGKSAPIATQRMWSHKSVPFGVAAMEYHVVMKNGDEVVFDMNMEFTLQDHGTGAKSLLPEKK